MDDDDSCVIKYIEIVPRDNFEDCSDVTDVKCEPLNVKVGVVSSFTSFIWYESTFMLKFHYDLIVNAWS